MAEAGQRNLIAARKIKTELARGEIGSRLRPSVEDNPGVTLLDLVDDFSRRHMDLQGSKTLFVSLVRNLDLARLLTISDVRAIEVVLVNLE